MDRANFSLRTLSVSGIPQCIITPWARGTKARLGKGWDLEFANKMIVSVQRAMGNKVGPENRR